MSWPHNKTLSQWASEIDLDFQGDDMDAFINKVGEGLVPLRPDDVTIPQVSNPTQVDPKLLDKLFLLFFSNAEILRAFPAISLGLPNPKFFHRKDLINLVTYYATTTKDLLFDWWFPTENISKDQYALGSLIYFNVFNRDALVKVIQTYLFIDNPLTSFRGFDDSRINESSWRNFLYNPSMLNPTDLGITSMINLMQTLEVMKTGYHQDPEMLMYLRNLEADLRQVQRCMPFGSRIDDYVVERMYQYKISVAPVILTKVIRMLLMMYLEGRSLLEEEYNPEWPWVREKKRLLEFFPEKQQNMWKNIPAVTIQKQVQMEGSDDTWMLVSALEHRAGSCARREVNHDDPVCEIPVCNWPLENLYEFVRKENLPGKLLMDNSFVWVTHLMSINENQFEELVDQVLDTL